MEGRKGRWEEGYIYIFSLEKNKDVRKERKKDRRGMFVNESSKMAR